MDEGRGLRKTFTYGGAVSKRICGTCRTFKSRLIKGAKIGSIAMPNELTPAFCVNLHKVVSLMGVCKILPCNSGDTTLWDSAAKLSQAAQAKPGWLAFNSEMPGHQVTRQMFCVSSFCLSAHICSQIIAQITKAPG